MTNFDADILRELRKVREVAIRTEKHPKTAVVIWVVVADEEVFVILDGEGTWCPVDVYVRDHSEAQFSHGLCSECGPRMRQQYRLPE